MIAIKLLYWPNAQLASIIFRHQKKENYIFCEVDRITPIFK